MKINISPRICVNCGGNKFPVLVSEEVIWRCECRPLAFHNTGIPRRYQIKRIDEMETNAMNSVLIENIKRINKGLPRFWSMVLVGPEGSGKTEFACLIARTMMVRGIDVDVQFTTVHDLLEKSRQQQQFRNPDGERIREWISKLKNATMLILDDLNGPRYTENQQGIIQDILNHRHSNRRPTIITTQKSFRELDSILRKDTMSRLSNSVWICPGMDDMRARDCK